MVQGIRACKNKRRSKDPGDRALELSVFRGPHNFSGDHVSSISDVRERRARRMCIIYYALILSYLPMYCGQMTAGSLPPALLVSPSLHSSHTDKPTPSSPTASLSLSQTMNSTRTLSATTSQQVSSSETRTTRPTSSGSASQSISPSSSGSASQSTSPSSSGSTSQSTSPSSSSSVSQSKSPSLTRTQKPTWSVTKSPSSTMSVSPSQSISASQSGSQWQSTSQSVTTSVSQTATASQSLTTSSRFAAARGRVVRHACTHAHIVCSVRPHFYLHPAAAAAYAACCRPCWKHLWA